MTITCKGIWHSLFLAHPPDKVADLAVDPRAAARPAGFPAPVATEATSMPTDHGFGLDYGYRIHNRREASVQPDKDQLIDVPKPHPRWGLSAEDDQLLTQDDIFSFEVRP